MRDFFPISAKATSGKALAVSIIIYLVISLLAGALLNLFHFIPLVGAVLKIISQFIDFYCMGGIVVSILIFCKIV